MCCTLSFQASIPPTCKIAGFFKPMRASDHSVMERYLCLSLS